MPTSPLEPARSSVRVGRAPLSIVVREQLFLLNQRRRLRRIARYWHPHADPAATVAAVRQKTLVMAVSAGRSGTTYLAKLLAAFPGTTSLHEVPPHYAFFMRQAQHSRAAARRFLLEYKLPCIAAAPTPRYADISHLFCKGFLEPLLELGIVPHMVMLRRDPHLVARSWLTRRVIPGRRTRGLKLHLHPGDPGVLPFPKWWRASDYQLCFWYALEIERRQHAYAELLERSGGRSIDVTPEELHDPERFLDMGRRFGMLDADTPMAPLLERHRELSSTLHKVNTRPPATWVPAEEEAVWAAVAPHAPWLRDDVARRYR